MDAILTRVNESNTVKWLFSFCLASIIVLNYAFGRILVIHILAKIKHFSEKLKFKILKKEAEPEEQEFSVQQDGYDNIEYNGSPINIDLKNIFKFSIKNPLEWCDYRKLPDTITLKNNGETVILKAYYSSAVPSLRGGNLTKKYNLIEVAFKWGLHDYAGTEHLLDYKKFALELQVLYNAGPCLRNNRISFDLLTVAYFYKIGKNNPLLEPIVNNLAYIRQPNTEVHLMPFPLSCLMPAFDFNYYSYEGSYRDKPKRMQTIWYIYPKQFFVGASQMSQFRLLQNKYSNNILRNARVLKPIGNRIIAWNVRENNDDEDDIF